MQFTNRNIDCPFCGKTIQLGLDFSQGDQEFIEDCPNCCNPIHCKMHINDANRTIELQIDADDEQFY